MSTAATARPTARTTIGDLLNRLGGIHPDRVRFEPVPGTATLDDLIAVNECVKARCANGSTPRWWRRAWGTLKAGSPSSFSASSTATWSSTTSEWFTPDAVLRILPGVGRAADVAFVSWAGLPGGRPPERSEPVPCVVPDLVIEVLSRSNTPGEMSRKRQEYFRAGVKRVWEIDPATRGAVAYTGPEAGVEIPPNGTLHAGEVMPGFCLSLQAVFDRAERRG